ncbi:hypothetical protein RSAG8_09880, partial [Rhizoctonia solani AG-8 WAC10335]
MEYYEHRIFDELSSDNIAEIAPLLLTLDIFSRFQTVTLPATIWLNVDLREYFVEVLANHLQHAPSGLRPPTNTATAPTDGLENAKEKEEDLETPAPRDHGTILMLNALDEKLQGTYNYLKRVFLMEEASKQPMFTSKLLPLMDDRNKELKKYYIRSKVPKMWLDKLEAFKNAREGQTSSSGAGPSSGSGAPPM